jgi:hypothetical protein
MKYQFAKYYLILLLLISCNRKENEMNFNVIIYFGKSYQFNLNEKKYIAYYKAKPSVERLLSLTPIEIDQVKKKIKELGLINIQKDVIINNSCEYPLESRTKIQIAWTNRQFNYQFNPECLEANEDSYLTYRLKKFLIFIDKLLIEKKAKFYDAPSDIENRDKL